MIPFATLLWTGYAILLISPLLPVVAAIANRRSTGFLRYPWMDRLTLAVTCNLLVNWALLSMCVRHIDNLWFDNLTFLPEFGLDLWVLSGLGPRRIPRFVIVSISAILVGATVLEAATTGLWLKWSTSMSISSILLIGLCFWRLQELFLQPVNLSVFRQPAFWVLAAWLLELGMEMTFYPLHAFFLSHLSRSWVLVPWLAKYALGLGLDLTLSMAFLCPKSISSSATS